MKHLKVTSVVLTIAICMSMFMPTVSVLADEASAPSETQTEETEKQTTKETEKPAAPKTTEKKETEPSEKKETEATEKPAPAETEKKEPSQTEKQEPAETEETIPAETEKQEPEQTETQIPAETEKQEPEETEKKEPEVTETQAPEETEEEAPEVTEEPVQETEVKKDAKDGRSGTCSNGFTWSLSDSGVLTVSGNGAMDTSSPWLSYSSSIKSVVISSGITSISYAAFYGCKNLTSVSLPSSLTTIEGSAFSGSALTSVSIPSSVTTIKSNAFYNCPLTSANIPSGIKIIYSYVFYGAKFSSITIPSTVTEIGDYAFGNCTNLTSITVPSSVSEIGAGVFSGCTKLAKATLNCTTLVNEKMGSGVFQNCSALTSVNIPSGCTLIEYFTFEGCTSLSQITIPEGVTEIQKSAFKDCTNLTSVTLPKGITYVAESCFEGCVKLKSITVPSNVTRIANYAFRNCTGMTSVTLPKSLEIIGLSAFSGCSGLADVYYTGSETDWNGISVYSDNVPLLKATLNCEGASSFNGANGTCGKNLTWKLTTDGTLTITGSGAMTDFDSTGSGAFIIYRAPWNTYKNKIKKVVFPSGITTIGNGAFNGCVNLTSITLPSSLTSVGVGAFSDSGITSLTIPSGVTKIEDRAFENCTNIKTVTLNSGIQSIGQYAFHGSGLQSINIPSTVTAIKDYAFQECSELKTVSFSNGLTSIGNSAFLKCKKLTGITLPGSLTSIGASAFSGTAITEITIPGSVVDVSGNVFSNCVNLTSATISSGVESLDHDVFFGCENLTSVSIPISLIMIGNAAFGGCNRLADVYYEGTSENWDEIWFSGTGHEQLRSAIMHYGSTGATRYRVILAYNNGGGTVSFSPATAAAGETVTINTTPYTGYTFDHFEIDGTRMPGNTFTMPAGNVEVEVYFKKIPYTITVTSSAGGTASCVYQTAGVGDLVTISTTPNTGYVVGSIKVNNETIEGNTFTMPAKNTTVYVTFVEGGYNVNLTVGPNGTASVSKTKGATGDKVTVTATPATGYVLDAIKLNGTPLASGVTVFTIGTVDVDVEVTFKKIAYTVSVSVPQGGKASASVSSAAPGDTVKLTYSEFDGYEFDRITLNGSLLLTDTFTMPKGNANVVVYFKKIQYTITVNYSAGGTASCEYTTAGVGDKITITTTPETGYSVESIKVNNSPIDGSSFSMPARNTTVYVSFVKGGYPVNLTVGANGKATVSKTTAGIGDKITVTATPDDGYVLDKITVNGTALASGVTQFTMGAAETNVVVSFKKLTYTVSVSVPQGGTASANVTSAGYGDTIKVTYSASAGYEFDKITLNGNVITSNTFTMPAGNAAVVVYFKKIAYTITVSYSAGGTASCKYETAGVGDLITVTTTPETGYSVASIKVNNVAIEGNSFEMPAKNTTVVVTFTKTGYPVNLTVGANGTASVSKETANIGDKITVTAKPAIGYIVDTIKVNGTALASGVTEFTMGAAAANVVVSFKKAVYSVNVSAPQGGTAKANVTTASYGDSIRITYTAPAGHTFDKITLNGNEIDGTTFSMPAEDAAVVVYFKKIDYAVNLTVGEHGTAKVSKNPANYGDTITVTVTPDEGYTLDTITVNGNALASGTMEFTMGTAAANVVVSFKKAKYAISVSVPQGGSATTNPTSANAGDSVTVNPSPATGYILDKITLNGEALSGTKFTMPAGDAAVVVFFKKAEYAVNLTVGDNGTAKVSKNPANYADVITVTATPSAGYVLDTIKVNGNALKAGVTTFTMGTSAANVVVSFKKATYSIGVSVPNGGGSASAKTSASAGDLITVTCTPNTGYELDKIVVNNAAITGNTFTMPAKDTTVVVSFKKAVYSVSINTPVGGTATLNKSSAYYGDTITVTTKAGTGYTLDKIYVNGTAISSGSSFTMPAKDTDVEVVFKQINYTISVTYGSNGTAKVSKNPANYGDKIVITATPSTGYTVDTIKVNGTALVGTMEFTMGNADATVNVTFKKAQYTITTSVPNGGGTATVVKMANAGDTVAVECKPNTGYVLDKILVNNNAITGTSFTMPQQNTTVVVSFKKAVYSVSINKPVGGTATLSATSAGYGELITVTATPSTGYELDSITVNGREIEISTFGMPDSAAVVVVTFKKIDYKITVKQPVNGTAGVSKNPANYGDTITVTATPAEGYTLDTIKVNGTALKSGVTTFTMGNAATTVEVTFKKIQYSITVKYTTGGTAYADPKTAGMDDMVSIICTPSNGYEVASITVNGQASEQNFLMPAMNTTVVVTFKKTDYAIVVAPDKNGSASVDKNPANVGDKITVTATPKPGYTLDSIKVNGNPITGNTFTMGAGYTTVEVYFKLKDLKVTVTALAGGTAKADVTTAKMGDTVTITATPADGYKLNYIMVNNKSQTASTFVMGSEDAVVTVAFVKIPYSVKLTVGANGTATVDPKTAVIGDIITVDAKPNENYYAIIKVNGEEIGGNTFTMPASNVTVNVTFDRVKPLDVGESTKVGNATYTITAAAPENGTGMVRLDKIEDDGTKAVVVPDTVDIKGFTYRVVSIGNNALANNQSMTSLYIGAYVTVIGSNACLGCKYLVKVSGGLRLKTIGVKAFASCIRLKTFVITSAVLSKISTYTFYGDKSLKTIYVNKTTKLSKKGVKKSLKGSAIKTVKVKKSKVKKYKKFFTKKNCGRKVKVKK